MSPSDINMKVHPWLMAIEMVVSNASLCQHTSCSSYAPLTDCADRQAFPQASFSQEQETSSTVQKNFLWFVVCYTTKKGLHWHRQNGTS